MGKRTRTTAYRVRFSGLRGLRLPALCVFFVLGAMLGHAAAYIAGGDNELAAYLRSAVSQEAVGTVSAVSVLLVYLRYPLIALFLGYCSFAMWAIPLLMSLQGFTLSFAAASLAVSLGRQGVLLALASFGLRSVVTVICTLLIGLWTLEKATKRDEGNGTKASDVLILCALLLGLGVILELTVMPKLFSLALAALK